MTFIYTALAGGVLAIAYSIYKRGFLHSMKLFFGFLAAPLFKLLYMLTGYHSFIEWYGRFKRTEMGADKLYIPYAIPITIGAGLVFTNWIPSFF